MDGLELVQKQRCFTRERPEAKFAVVHEKEEGYLLVTSQHLCFFRSCTGSPAATKRWAWKSLNRVTANAAMRITHMDSSKRSLFFQFRNQNVMMAATRDFQSRIMEARTVYMDQSDEMSDVSMNKSDFNYHCAGTALAKGMQLPQTGGELVALVNQMVKTQMKELEENRGGMPQSREELKALVKDTLIEEQTNGSNLVGRKECSSMEDSIRSNGMDHTDITGFGNREQAKGDELTSKTEAITLDTEWEMPQTTGELIALMNLVMDKCIHAMKPIINSPALEQDKTYPSQQVDGESSKANDEEEWHSPLGETVYSLLYLCKFNSQGFGYACFIYLLQMSTICLTLVDIIHHESSNPLQIPPMVGVAVTCSQAIAVFMAVAYQSDFIEAVVKFQDGYYPEVLEQYPGATFNTWLFSCIAQMVSGLLLLVLSFILTMQVETVVDGMLNLTALLFMAEIDDVGFAMARMGFIRTRLQHVAQAVSEIKVPRRHRRNLQRRLLYFLTLIGLFAGYGIIKHRQLNGYYLQTYIYVQFGDAYNPKLPYYSGILSSKNTRTNSYREYRDLDTANILLGYCRADKLWTFSEVDDPCDYFAKSSETLSYDVTSIGSWEWQVKDSRSRFHPFDSFSLVGRDCDLDTCQGVCGADGLCSCLQHQFGIDCEFSNVCPELTIDGNLGPFPLTQQHGNEFVFEVDTEFELLKDGDTGEFVRVYNMPVYYSPYGTAPATVIFFSGRRWVITTEWDLMNLSAEEKNSTFSISPETTAAVLKNNFHGHYQAQYVPLFLSDPVDFETPDFQPTPSGLGWWSVRVTRKARHYSPGSSVKSIFNCKTCHSDQGEFCGVQGLCNPTTGLCDCIAGFTGAKCEEQLACYEQDLPCYGDGVCDQISGVCRCNKPFGGKLCESGAYCTSEDGKCQNGGECDTATGDCNCPRDPALGSWACEKFADCHIYGCSNGGVCALNGKCVCRPPFHGILCDLVNATQKEFSCSKNADCSGGTCNTTTGICSCKDPNKYGTLCEHHYNCTWGGCRNSGTCNTTTGLCACPEPFFGPECTEEPACLEDAYCESNYGAGSICDTLTGACRCGWGAAYVGKKCYNNCKNEGCHNGGICNEHGYCECPPPYTGLHCEYLTVDVSLDSGITERVEACVEQHGFPPYNGTTDCRRNQFNEP